jgi:hypothetical protein
VGPGLATASRHHPEPTSEVRFLFYLIKNKLAQKFSARRAFALQNLPVQGTKKPKADHLFQIGLSDLLNHAGQLIETLLTGQWFFFQSFIF